MKKSDEPDDADVLRVTNVEVGEPIHLRLRGSHRIEDDEIIYTTIDAPSGRRGEERVPLAAELERALQPNSLPRTDERTQIESDWIANRWRGLHRSNAPADPKTERVYEYNRRVDLLLDERAAYLKRQIAHEKDRAEFLEDYRSRLEALSVEFDDVLEPRATSDTDELKGSTG